MSLKWSVWGLAATVGWGTMAATAAEVTPQGAAEVKAGLERYLGHGADGGPVAVTPAGSAYKIDIDLKKALHGLEQFGVVLEPVTYTMLAAPQDDGTFHVTSEAFPPVTAKFGEQSTSIVANGQHFDGTFDPRIPAFTRSSNGYDSLSIGVIDKRGATQARQLNHGQQSTTATVAADGVIDGKVTQSNSDFLQDVALDQAKAGKPSHISIKSGPTRETLGIDGLHIRALTDLWAFLVAHPSASALKANQADLKTLLRQALPLFQRWSQDESFDEIKVDSPFGLIAAHAVAAHFDFRGLTADGSAALAVKADGLTVPTAGLPSWTTALVPTGFDLHNAVSGYRLDQTAQAAIDDLDLQAPQPYKPEAVDRMKRLLGSPDKIVVSIGESWITSPTFELRFQGEVRMTPPVPAFTATFHATGLDKSIQLIQSKAGQDETATQAIAVLMLVKGYGKAEPDGSVTWAVAGDGTGAVTVNGVPLPFGRK